MKKDQTDMPTYILVHNPYRKNATGKRENPAQEIMDNIRAINLATTAFGGWSIGMSIWEIEPESRLLFYRSGSGFFAVGRALPADHSECRELRKAALRKWYPDNPDADKMSGAIKDGLAAYRALGWDTGEDETFHINAVWEVVADPQKGRVLSLQKMDSIGLVFEDDKDPSGIRILDSNIADDICKECKNSRHRYPPK